MGNQLLNETAITTNKIKDHSFNPDKLAKNSRKKNLENDKLIEDLLKGLNNQSNVGNNPL